MRYVVLGCGAIGGTVAAGLVRDGRDVLVSDADPDVVAAINARGLRIEGPVENFTVTVPAVLPGDLPPQLDGPVLVAVKSQHTAAAAAALAGRMHGDGYVVSLQNGLNADQLAEAVGAARVVEAFVNFGADVIAPGWCCAAAGRRSWSARSTARSPAGSGRWPPTSPTPGPPSTSWATCGARRPTGRCWPRSRSATCRSPTGWPIRPTARCWWPWPARCWTRPRSPRWPSTGSTPRTWRDRSRRWSSSTGARPRPTPGSTG